MSNVLTTYTPVSTDTVEGSQNPTQFIWKPVQSRRSVFDIPETSDLEEQKTLVSVTEVTYKKSYNPVDMDYKTSRVTLLSGRKTAFSTLAGTVPTLSILTTVEKKTLVGVVVSAITSVLGGNELLIVAFLVLNLFNFFVALPLDKSSNFREKLSHLVADTLLVSLAGIAQLVLTWSFGAYAPLASVFSVLNIFIIVLSIMVITYTFKIGKSLIGVSTLAKNSLIVEFFVLAKKHIADFKDEASALFEKHLPKQ